MVSTSLHYISWLNQKEDLNLTKNKNRKITLTNLSPELQALFLKKIQQMYDDKELHSINSIDRNGLMYSQSWIQLEESESKDINYCSYCNRILDKQDVKCLDDEFCNLEHKKQYFISLEMDEQT
jgi:hypothetical protein